MNRTLRNTYAVLTTAAMLFGCASVDPLPESWPKPRTTQTDECPDLSGSYSNHGEGAGDSYSGGLLVEHVFPQADRGWTKSDWETNKYFSQATHVTFHGPNKHGLVIEAWNGSELIGRIESNDTGGYRCDAGGLLLTLPIFPQAQAGVWLNTRERTIFLAENGSIIVKHDSFGAGLGFYFIPLAMKFEGWSIYPSINPKQSK